MQNLEKKIKNILDIYKSKNLSRAQVYNKKLLSEYPSGEIRPKQREELFNE